MTTGHHDHQRRRAYVAATSGAMPRRVPPPAYYEDLLRIAEDFLVEGQDVGPEMAVILSQMALEIATALAMRAGSDKQKAYPPEPTDNTNPANKDVLKRYKKLTGDRIDTRPFWHELGAHVERRHGIVHRGERISPAEARESVDVVRQAITHLDEVRRALQ